MEAVKDASHLYQVERRARHAERPGFRISELTISPVQQVPWHYHTSIQDTFYVLEGELRLFLRDPKEDVRLRPGETYAVRPGRPHLVTNGASTSTTFLVLQGIGEYDYVPLTHETAKDVEPRDGRVYPAAEAAAEAGAGDRPGERR
jgi:quercetin dioxygenase-like cupin family protein